MSTKHNRIPVQAQRKTAPISVAAMNQMVAQYNNGQWDLLEATAREATKRHPEHIFGWKALGKTLLQSGKFADALNALSRAVKIAPNDADTHIDLAVAFHALGQFDGEEKSYRSALKLNPGAILTYVNLGVLLCELGKHAEAEAEFRHALELDPQSIEAHINLGFVSDKLARWNDAEASYRRALAISPDFAEGHRRLGDLLARLGNRSAEVVAILQRAIELNPHDAGSVVTLGNVLLAAGQVDESSALFRQAQQMQPLITWPTKKPKADFSVLLLDAPGAGSTPVNYLVGHATYDCHFLAILPGVDYDLDFLRSRADVVVNMIADADNGVDVLPLALDLADRLALPVVNHPRRILDTDRQTIADRLSDIALCRIPKTVRLSAAMVAGADWRKCIDGFAMPLLIRCAGTHGGDDFEKVDDAAALVAFMEAHPAANFYVSEFVDYSSADGYFRKYRLICIHDQILPYHLAIHNHWMVHHFRTDMANQEWMREEEVAFLKEPQCVFGEEHFAALRKVGGAVGLDYCGIDCSLDRDGKIVVFEANATMRVHDEKDPIFIAKNPYIVKIKVAFDTMLARLAAIQ
jgi:Tfp pilus assembly protein PilF/glutathione synthase/RimK-type ligase-like ATP-grasp enzyme